MKSQTLQQVPWKVDPRDKKFTEIVFGAGILPEFRKTLYRARQPIKNQGVSLSCTAQGTTLASEYQEKEELSAAWIWKEVCKQLGTAVPNGADWRVACKIHIKKGALKQSLAKYSFPKDDYQVIGNWQNWDEVPLETTEIHKKAAFVPIPKVGDWFDSVKAALQNGYEKNQVVMIASAWYYEWGGVDIPTVYTNISGYHFHTFIDFDSDESGEFIWGQNSYGENMGDRGCQKWRRETVNEMLSPRYATAIVWEDLTEEQIKRAKEETVFGRIHRAIIDIWYIISTL